MRFKRFNIANVTGAGYMEMAAAAMKSALQGATASVALVGVAIAAPLVFTSPVNMTDTIIEARVALNTGQLQLKTGNIAHVTATASRLDRPANTSILETVIVPTERLFAGCSEPLAATYAYERLHSAGLQYGSSFRLLQTIKQGPHTAAAIITQPPSQLHAEFLFNPAVLDSCLQLGGMVPSDLRKQQEGTYVPAALAALHIGQSVGSSVVAAAIRAPGTQDSEAAVVRNHAITTRNGSVVCTLDGLQSKSTSGSSTTRARLAADVTEDILYEIDWLAAQVADPSQASSSTEYNSISVTTTNATELAAAAIASLQGGLESSVAAAQLTTTDTSSGLLSLAGGDANTAVPGQMWGMMRTFAQERPDVSVDGCRIAAACPNNASVSSSFPRMLLSRQETSQPSSSTGFDGYGATYQASTMYAPYMQHTAARSAAKPFQLLPMPRGSLNSLAPQSVDVDTVKSGYVAVAVKAIGLNFR